MTQCILLNADYSFLNIVDWRRALRLIANGKVKVLRYSERIVASAEGVRIKLPAVMKLIKLIRILYRNRVPFSKRNVLIRDGFRCGYCGSEKERLTLDHIVPRSRGGKTDFENCIASCRTCNNKKGNKTPREARMFLKARPYQPTISEFLRMKVKRLNIDVVLEELGIY